MRRRNVMLILGVVAASLSGDVPASDAKDCAKRVTPLTQIGATEELAAYLGSLLENRIIGDTELGRLINGIESGALSNPITEDQAQISSAALIHREKIQEYLQGTIIDRKKLLDWSQNASKELARVRVRRQETQTETSSLYHQMRFHSVPAGSFQMEGEGTKYDVRLTHPFEVMATDVTQKMWVEEMGANPSRIRAASPTITIDVRGKRVELQPDHPVTKLTWWSAVTFANRMSEKMGLRPAYDLRQIKWKPGTSAEEGTLVPDMLEGTQKLRIDAPEEDIYRAEGFRLPTEAEWEYLLRNLGTANGDYPHGLTEAELANYAWYMGNSGNEIQPVATTARSFWINGNEFHDLVGNVWKWIHDWHDSRRRGGDDPKGPKNSVRRMVRGGSYAQGVVYLRSDARGASHTPNERPWPETGFRLVRTLK